jgi:two-component system LytT family sensor kinase
MITEQLNLILLLLQQMCVYLLIAYLLSKTPLFTPLMQVTIRLPHKLACYAVFSTFCVLGTYLGLNILGSIANTRAIGAVLGGLLGGPAVGLAIGFTGGVHRYSLGGPTALACMISTISEGLLSGLIHRYLMKQGRVDLLFKPLLVASVALVAEIMQMLIILAVAQPFSKSLALVENIGIPMMIANTLGSAMFMRILLDRREMLEKYSNAFSAKALRIAARSEGALRAGFDEENTLKVAKIILEELSVSAVSMTDRTKVLAFIGSGADHHLPGSPITSEHTFAAIRDNRVVYADGNEVPYICSISPRCPLGSTLVIPLWGDDGQVIGTIKLYENRGKLFLRLNRTLGEGIARLLSTQILSGRIEAQQLLLAQTEVKLLHAQVNPHFLFNTLNTISAVIRNDPDRARKLIQYLSVFFRKNLKRTLDEVTLADEIEHVNAYLQIELARFSDHLKVDIDLSGAILQAKLPAFSLQPVVENAIKHGTSQLFDQGHIRIYAEQNSKELLLHIEDNAGLYPAKIHSEGLGMKLVDRRIKAIYGAEYGVSVHCVAEKSTRISLHLPVNNL